MFNRGDKVRLTVDLTVDGILYQRFGRTAVVTDVIGRGSSEPLYRVVFWVLKITVEVPASSLILERDFALSCLRDTMDDFSNELRLTLLGIHASMDQHGGLVLSLESCEALDEMMWQIREFAGNSLGYAA